MHKWLCGLVVALTSIPAFAQVDLSYRPNPQPGDQIRAQRELKMRQTLTIAGMPQETKVDQFQVESTTFGSPQEDGSVPAVLKSESVRMNFGLPGGLSYDFDSENSNASTPPDAIKPIVDFLKSLTTAELDITFDSKGGVKDLKWKNDAFADVDPGMKDHIDPEILKKRMTQWSDQLPNHAVNKGDSWTRTEDVAMGGGQKMQLEQEFTYLGPGEVDGKPIERISVTTKSCKLWMDPLSSSTVSFKDCNLAVKESKGLLTYDPEQHVITRTETLLHVSGTLTVVSQGQEFPSELDRTISKKDAQQ